MPRKPTLRVRTYERKADRAAITPREYGGLQAAFDLLNRELFGGELPDLFIVYSRRARSGGHYAPKRYSGRGSEMDRDELSLNPDSFIGKSDEWIVSMLVHEMVHHWQEKFGKQRRANYAYHDKEWAAKMKSLGLMPSNNGMVGGKETGQRMSHYIIPDGAYAIAFAALAAKGWKLNLQSAPHAGGSIKPRKNKSTYDCLHCGWTCWGKPNSLPICGPCILQAAPLHLHDFLRAYIAPDRDAANADVAPAPPYDQQPAPMLVESSLSYDPPPDAGAMPTPSYDQAALG